MARLVYPNINQHLNWIDCRDDALYKYNKKIMIGFLTDSHCEILGIFSLNPHRGSNIGSIYGFGSIYGYCCSHFRELSEEELKTHCHYLN